MRSISRQPSARTRLPFAVKEWPQQSNVAVTVSYIYGSADAHSSLQQTKRNKLRSPRVRALISAFSTSIVGMIAWWSDTSLSEIMASTSGKKLPQPSKGGSFATRWITQDAVSAISEVRYRLSVRG